MKKIVFCILPVLFSDVSSFPLPQPVCGSEQICRVTTGSGEVFSILALPPPNCFPLWFSIFV
jgi:hypothetical protein